MNRWIILASLLAAVGASVSDPSPAVVANPPVELQPSSPGIRQVGSANISGTLLAGNLVGEAPGPYARAVEGTATSATGFNFGGYFQSPSTDGRGVFGAATATSGLTYGGYFRSASTGGRAVVGEASATSGVNVGGFFTTASNEGRGVVAIATATTGTNYGIRASSASQSGYAGYFSGRVYSSGNVGIGTPDPLQPLSVNGNAVISGIVGAGTFSGSGSLLTNVPWSSITGAPHTLLRLPFFGVSNSGSGFYVRSTNSGNAAVRGEMTAPIGNGYGGYFESQSTSGIGVRAIASGSNYAYGGLFSSVGANGIGLYSICDSTTGTNWGVYALAKSTSGRALEAVASATTGSSYGVRGGSNSPQGYGLYSVGRTGASGTKSFRIDHPLDPANRYLSHYSAEGPEPLNVYCGTVVTDGQGFAWVQLPDYFEEINRDFRYQLTVVDGTDDFVLAKVAREIEAGRFQVRTSKPRTKVCWEVKGTRNDAFVRAHGAPVETDKPVAERGRFQHPELYGLPLDRGMISTLPVAAPPK